MSKDKSLDTIMLHGKNAFTGKHNIPREFANIYPEIEELDFVESLGIGRFKQTNKEKGIEIIGFDDCTKTYSARIIGEKYEQKLFLKVDKKYFGYEHHLKCMFG